MALEAGDLSAAERSMQDQAATITARQDRLPLWPLPTGFLIIIGLGTLFTLFDTLDINVSFIQTCVQIVHGCNPTNAAHFLSLPSMLNLIGYVIGELIFSTCADRFGRRNLLMMSMLVSGLGSLYTGIAGDYTNFILARVITGIGAGADIALTSTYLSELTPRRNHVHYLALTFIVGSFGSILSVWLGLFLTTPMPLGLPLGLTGLHFEGIGWRLVYFFGALLAVIGLLLRFELPESPRWLVSRGRLTEAERIVGAMEQQVARRLGGTLPPLADEVSVLVDATRIPLAEILRTPLYLKRTILLLTVWLLSLITLFAAGAALTALLLALGYPIAQAALITAVASIGYVLASITAASFGEKFERKTWMPIAGVAVLLGGLLIAFSSGQVLIAIVGATLLNFGNNVWLPMIYTWSAENYPTRARATGFALVEGIGHIGGGVGLVFLVSLIRLGPTLAFLAISAFMFLAALLAQFGPTTKEKPLDEVSP
ncbi:MFS transporter [Ktedonosporobacter rubrisoli]|uniref:MFS transporter n=1 Tax=Ktedonosporobacter rubrisoli TaxID=2509675 RepID=A0A4V0YY31_KTERU|nr:MFS transporter [Ktedonosporobacter rubrisoli]QBD74801.1 MFS transporter [Ktedonosporobacter rubrisoli]